MPQKVLSKEQIQELINSGDLTPDIAMAKLLPPEQAIYNKLATADLPTTSVPFKDATRPAGPPSTKGLAMAGASMAGGLALGNAPAIMGAARGFSAAHPLLTAGAGMTMINQAQKWGLPAPIAQALETAAGLKAMMGVGGAAAPAAAEGAAMGAEEAAIRAQLAKKGYPPELIDKLVKADGGPAAAPAAAPAVPGISNVAKEGPLTGITSDVNKGFHPGGGLFEFPKQPSTRATTADYATDNAFTRARGGAPGLLERGLGGEQGRVADPEAFQRALEEELKWVQAQKGLTNSNASTSGYDAWVAQQGAKIPPVGTSLDQLATKGLRSLRRSPK